MMDKGAIFSDCRRYRYTLHRMWSRRKGVVAFIGLNPSTADENIDDPTVRRCIRYADSWGYGGMYMLNIFAFRSTNPKGLYGEDNPIGPDNDAYLSSVTEGCVISLCCWGTHGDYLDRGHSVLLLIANPHYLKMTKAGQPGHPLYLPKKLQPIKWEV